MVVADNSSLEERKCILYRLGRRPVSLFQFLAVIALQELLFRDEALVAVMVTVILLTTPLTPLIMRWAFSIPCPHDLEPGGSQEPEKKFETPWD